MRFANPYQVRRTARNTLAATACCALLAAAGILSGSPASASAGPLRQSGTALQAALRQDLSHYLTTQRKAEHISAVRDARLASRIRSNTMAMDWHDTLMGSVLVISGGLTFAYTRAASKILLILTLIGAAATIVIGVLLFFHLA